MDPVTSLIAGHAAGKVIDRAAAAFRVNVIERWSKHRAQHFFQQFCQEVERELDGERSEALEPLLEKILEADSSSEVLFDAYRRVALSRSKAIGPRVIGVLIARMALMKRLPTAEEEAMLDAAEQLYDNELLDFASFCEDYRRRAEDERRHEVTISDGGALRIKWDVEQLDSNWHREFNVSLAPLNLEEACGTWATKLEALGMIQTDLTERQWAYREDGERHIDQDGTVREITWWIVMSCECFELAEVIARVNTAPPSTA